MPKVDLEVTSNRLLFSVTMKKSFCGIMAFLAQPILNNWWRLFFSCWEFIMLFVQEVNIEPWDLLVTIPSFVTFSNRTSDTSSTQKISEPKTITIFPSEDRTTCPVRVFYLYHSKMPMKRKCPALYLWPRKSWAQDGVWYEDRAIDVNTLHDTIKKMCKDAGFEGNFMNHSLQSTSATHMYESGIEEQVIIEITGHRSLCIWSYKRTSTTQKHKASEVLLCSGKKPKLDWTVTLTVCWQKSLKLENN